MTLSDFLQIAYKATVVVTGASSGIARAAALRFARRGSCLGLCAREPGVLINLSSVWGRVTSPYVSPYVASKSAVRAFSESLRGELRHLPDVHITTVSPQAVDTPIFDNAANCTGRRVRAIPPMLSPEEVAEGFGNGTRRSGPGNALEPVGAHAVEGGWRRARPGTLCRAFLAASMAALLGRARGREGRQR